MRVSRLVYIRFIGLAVFILLLFNLDYSKIWSLIVQVRWNGVVLIISMIFLILVIKGFRWYFLVRDRGAQIRWGVIKDNYIFGLAAGMLTPGRLGEIVKVIHLSKNGLDQKHGLFLVVFDRLIDLSMLFFAGTLAFVVYLEIDRQVVIWLSVIFLVISYYIYIHNSWLSNCTDFIVRFIKLPGNYEINKIVSTNSVRRGGLIFLSTGLIWVLNFYLVSNVSGMLNINLVPEAVVLSVVSVTFATMLPLTFAGLGTRDLVLIYLFNNLGIGVEEAMLFSSVLLLIYFFILLSSQLVYHINDYICGRSRKAIH